MIATLLRRSSRLAGFSAGLYWLSVAALAGAAELPTGKPADLGMSAERLARLDAAMQDFAGRFQTLAYQAIVD